MTTMEGYGVSYHVLASFRREPHWDELLVEWIARLRSACVQYSSPVAYTSDDFPGLSDLVSEEFLDRVFLVVHGWHYTDVHAMFVEASRLAFGGEDAFVVVDFDLPILRSFVAASWFADAPNLLQVSWRVP